MNCKSAALTTWLIAQCIVPLFTDLATAGEIRGKVTAIAGNVLTIKLESDLVPNVGDKAEISFTTPDGDKIPVGEWRVSEVSGSAVTATKVKAAGPANIDMTAVIHSENPQKTSGLGSLDPKKAEVLIRGAGFAKSYQVIKECDEGAVVGDGQNFPQQSLGNPPDRIVNWELGLAKGKYKVRVSSPLDFEPFVYKKIKGEYKWAGQSRTTKQLKDRSGRDVHAFDFTANPATSVDENWWLLQMKPKAQDRAQKMRLTVNCTLVGSDR